MNTAYNGYDKDFKGRLKDPFRKPSSAKLFVDHNNNPSDCTEFIKEFYDDAVIFVTGKYFV